MVLVDIPPTFGEGVWVLDQFYSCWFDTFENINRSKNILLDIGSVHSMVAIHQFLNNSIQTYDLDSNSVSVLLEKYFSVGNKSEIHSHIVFCQLAGKLFLLVAKVHFKIEVKMLTFTYFFWGTFVLHSLNYISCRNVSNSKFMNNKFQMT